MKKNRWALRAVVLVALSVLLNGTVTMAGAAAGGSEDPLVTLSYLNDTFLGDILQRVDEKIAARNSQIVQQLGGQGTAGSATAATTKLLVRGSYTVA